MANGSIQIYTSAGQAAPLAGVALTVLDENHFTTGATNVQNQTVLELEGAHDPQVVVIGLLLTRQDLDLNTGLLLDPVDEFLPVFGLTNRGRGNRAH